MVRHQITCVSGTVTHLPCGIVQVVRVCTDLLQTAGLWIGSYGLLGGSGAIRCGQKGCCRRFIRGAKVNLPQWRIASGIDRVRSAKSKARATKKRRE